MNKSVNNTVGYKSGNAVIFEGLDSSDRLVMPTPVKHDLKPGDKVLLEGILLEENVYADRIVATVI